MRAPTLALVGVLMAGTVEATPLRYEWTGNVSAVSGSFGEFFNELGIGSPFFVSMDFVEYEFDPSLYVAAFIEVTMPQLVVTTKLGPFVDPYSTHYFETIGHVVSAPVPLFVNGLGLFLTPNRLGTIGLALETTFLNPNLGVGIQGTFHTFKAISGPAQPVPEPATILLTLVGLGAGATIRRRQQHSSVTICPRTSNPVASGTWARGVNAGRKSDSSAD